MTNKGQRLSLMWSGFSRSKTTKMKGIVGDNLVMVIVDDSGVNSVSIVVDFHIFNLVRMDVILGISWLGDIGRGLGKLENFIHVIEQNGKKLKLQVNPFWYKSQVSLKFLFLREWDGVYKDDV
ncbi:hypothetical protein CR513_56810, partial [Mucuna pruriens]